MKKLIVIGAGIAGLTCGIYAEKNGFETEIYELHTIPGGECTGWDRKGYHFDGCLHWLVGSKKGTSLNEIWYDTGALDDGVKIIQNDVFLRYEEEGKAVNFYTDADKLEKHLTEVAPEDKSEIRKFCRALRKMGGFEMPVAKPMDKMTAGDGVKFALANLGALPSVSRYNKLTMDEFAARFKNPLLQRAIKAAVPGGYTAMALVSTLAGMNAGDCGYPDGGSRALAKRMEKRYLELGGKVFYQEKVEKILVKEGKAQGIRLADGQEVYGDYVVSCADAYATLMRMLEDQYTPDIYKNLFREYKTYPTVTSALVFMGIDAELPFDYRGVETRRPQTIEIAGMESDAVYLLHYGFDRHMAPAGKTVIAAFYHGNYDHWKALAADPEAYRAEKKKLEEDAIAALIRRYPQAEGKIEITDVATPMTYERFCNAWRGSWMTWVKDGGDVPSYFPGKLPGLENFLMAGMWTLPPGGLPGAGASGRFAAHRLCLENGMPFETGFSC